LHFRHSNRAPIPITVAFTHSCAVSSSSILRNHSPLQTSRNNQLSLGSPSSLHHSPFLLPSPTPKHCTA
jgi:hypothetical protein